MTVATADEANRAISQLSGNVMLERKVSLQRARAERTVVPGSGTSAVEEIVSAPKNDCMEEYHDNKSVDNGDGFAEESHTLDETLQAVSPGIVQAAPPLNWNAVHITKIRTKFGGSAGKLTNPAIELGLENRNRVQIKGLSDRELG